MAQRRNYFATVANYHAQVVSVSVPSKSGKKGAAFLPIAKQMKTDWTAANLTLKSPGRYAS
jgi:hypothetical protein